MSTWVENNPYRHGRSYVFAFPGGGEAADPLWEINGTLRKGSWSLQRLQNSVQKAATSGYKKFLFSEVALASSEFEQMVQIVLQKKLQPVLQIRSELSLQNGAALLEKYPLHIERWIDKEGVDWDSLRALKKKTFVSLRILGVKTNPMLHQIEKIPQDFRDTIEFYFPYNVSKKLRLKPREVMAWREALLRKIPDFVIKPASGVDIFEPRISHEAELEPCHGPIYQSHAELQPKVSVVIPVYNTGFYLLNTLRHLDQQNVDPSLYEVVIVDDGSSDRVSQNMVELVRGWKMPITVLYYPRLRKRQMGDSQFRAGLARNYGVKFARGEILTFLDSDILTPPNFIQKTIQLHQSYTVVQWRREYLNKSVPCANIGYHEVSADTHCYIPEGGYWHQFYQNAQAKGWQALPDHWKYACTYGFSLPKEVFQEAGWFRKTFCFYGLEDTDLGWRLAQAQHKFHLEQTPVYHLFHEDVRSEFSNSSYRRQKLLKTTAEIFFYNNLSPDIYRVFQYLLNSWIF